MRALRGSGSEGPSRGILRRFWSGGLGFVALEGWREAAAAVLGIVFFSSSPAAALGWLAIANSMNSFHVLMGRAHVLGVT